MSDKVYEIRTMADFRALDPEQRRRVIPELLAWAEMADALEEASDMMKISNVFRWADDGGTGVRPVKLDVMQ